MSLSYLAITHCNDSSRACIRDYCDIIDRFVVNGCSRHFSYDALPLVDCVLNGGRHDSIALHLIESVARIVNSTYC